MAVAGGAGAPSAGDGHGLPRVPLGFVPAPAVRDVFSTLPPVVIFRAPRGFGKTSTASSWLRQQDGRVHSRVWVNVPNRRIDADEFWALVHRRVRDAGLGDLDGPDTWDDVERIVHQRGQLLVLAIDGFHHVRPGRVDEELLQVITNHESLRLVVMMRTERPIETLASITADALVLRVAELALGANEVASLGAATGRPMSEREAERLCAELMGWPAMVRAVLLESSRGPRGELLVDWSAVEKYTRLVLADPDVVRDYDVIAAIAVPREFTAELLEHLLGRDVAERALRQILKTGVFAQSEVDGVPTYRLPAAVRDAIGRVFREQDRLRYCEVNRAMALWHRNRAEPQQALDHAIRAEDWHHAAQIVESYWVELVSAHPEQVRDALARVPRSIIRGSARLLVARDYILNVAADERSMVAIRSGLLEADAESDLNARDTVRLSLGQVLALRSTGQYEMAREIVERQRVDLLAAEGEWTPDVLAEMPELLLQWSITRLFMADAVGAAYAFREAYRWAREREMVPARREAAAGLALALALLGHDHAAQRWLARLDSLPVPPGMTLTALEVTGRRLVRETIDLDMLRATEAGPWEEPELPLALADLRALALQTQASRAIHNGDRFEMIGILESYRHERASGEGGRGLADHVLHAALVDLLIATGQSDRARTVLVGADRGVPWLAMAHARQALFAGEYTEAMAITEGCAGHAGTRPRVALHLSLIRACAAHRLTLADQAADALHLAIAIAGQSGLLRPFALVPRADLVQVAATMPQAREFLDRPELAGLPEAFGPPHEAVRLSDRERRVLTEIAPGLSLSHAARRLYVSENTIKTQMRNIYRKLDVHTRDDAIARARDLGLLPPEPLED